MVGVSVLPGQGKSVHIAGSHYLIVCSLTLVQSAEWGLAKPSLPTIDTACHAMSSVMMQT